MPAPEELATALEATFARLAEAGEVDLVTSDDEDAIEVQADTWTLFVQGWPLATAWIALDDDAVSPREREQVLSASLRPRELAALRALDTSLDGALAAALRASADPISATLAELIDTNIPS